MFMKKIGKEGGHYQAIKRSYFAILYSLPWCCILPLVLSSLGMVASIGAVRIWTGRIMPVLFVITMISLAWTHWLLYSKYHYNPFYALIVWINTIIALILWALFFGFFPPFFGLISP